MRFECAKILRPCRYCLWLCFLTSLQQLTCANGSPQWELLDPKNYSYSQYLLDFPEKTVSSEEQYAKREQTFRTNLEYIHKFNQNQTRGKGHLLGVNEFLDRFKDEYPQRGYNKAKHEAWRENTISLSDQTDTITPLPKTWSSYEINYWTMIDHFTVQTELPKTVDWRIDPKTGRPLASPVKAQGNCGSCWAFASVAAIESHIALQLPDQALMSLSMQELVSCLPNPNHCGGTGGCGGSTAELAFDFVASHGLVDEWTFGYQNFDNPHKIECTLKNISGDILEKTRFFNGAVASVDGYVKLPTNNYTALMHAVAKVGPIVVNVADDNWVFYEKGVFTDHGHSVARTDINHVVVLMGYGTDSKTGEDYWLIRNSYGVFWGEQGYIRLKRTDPGTLPQPDADCGMDVRPADGIACTETNNGEIGHPQHITPPAVKVCGASGILFDPIVPVGARALSPVVGGTSRFT